MRQTGCDRTSISLPLRRPGGLVVLGIFLACAAQLMAGPSPAGGWSSSRAAVDLVRARNRYEAWTNDVDAAWQYGRACYEAARCATNRTEKARVAQQGIDVCRRLIARQPASAAGHYYLSLNIGEVADTRRNFAALGMVRDMEKEFKKAIELEERFDYAGPDRALGLLYQEAPVFGSIGSRSKARQHFKRALELSPEFPENRLVFIEANLKWGDASAARREIADLEQDWEPARSRFSGARWEPAWEEWDARLAAAKKKAGAVASRPVAEAPRNK